MTLHLEDSVFVMIDKPVGLSSHDVVAAVKKSLNLQKVGHAGTLDPFASGALPVFLGQWTKLTNLFAQTSKKYQATISFGAKTDTGDHTGKVIQKARLPVLNQAQCKLLERSLIGVHKLPVPIYSAAKINGKPMYQLAREGKITHSSKETSSTIIDIKITPPTSSSHLDLELICSGGTYVRSVAELIAEKIKTVGHLSALRRVSYYIDGKELQIPLVKLEDFLSDPCKYSINKNQLYSFLPRYWLNRQLYRDFLVGHLRRIPLKRDGWLILDAAHYPGPFGLIYVEKGYITHRMHFQQPKNLADQA